MSYIVCIRCQVDQSPTFCPALAVTSKSIMMTGHSTIPFSARRLGWLDTREVLAIVLQKALQHFSASSGERLLMNSSWAWV